MNEKFLSFSNIKLRYYDTESPGTTIILAHANGYSASCYKTYIESLKSNYRVLALDFSGHSGSESSLDFNNWLYFRDQILSLLNKELSNREKAIGIGHSLGGASILLASQKSPELFQKVIALDPVVLGWKMTTLAKIFGNPLAKQARVRRKIFSNTKLIERGFKKFPAFANWDEEIWKDYLNTCFKKTGNGEEVELCCDPVLEAKIFSLSSYKVLVKFYGIKVESHICIPEKYEVCNPRLARIITQHHHKSSVSIWKNATHFFPFEWKEKTLNYLNDRLKV